MLRVPLYLVVAQWALLGALGVLVFVLFRSLGRLLAGQSKQTALGPPVGAQAAALAYVRPGEQAARQLKPGGGQPLLIGFVDPTCPSCEELVRVMDAMSAAGDLAGVRVLLLISDPASYLRISAAFSETGLEIGRPSDQAGLSGLDAYRVSATPLLVAVDADGIVRAAGSVIRPAQVRQYQQAALVPAKGLAGPAGLAEAAVAVKGRGSDEP
jgi:hypothetical protein